MRAQGKFYIAVVPSLVLVWSLSAFGGESSVCGTLLQAAKEFPKASAAYVVDLWNTKGLRLAFTKDIAGRSSLGHAGFLTPNDAYFAKDGPKWRATKTAFQALPRRVIGLFRGERGHINDCIHGDPSYAFTPVRGAHFCLLDFPISRLSRILKTSSVYVASLPLIFTAWAIPTGYGLGVWADHNNQKIQAAEDQAIARDRTKYTDLIRYDIRFRPIKKELEKNLRLIGIPSGDEPAYARIVDGQIQYALRRAYELDISNQTLLALSVDDFDYNKNGTRGALEMIKFPQFRHLSDWVVNHYTDDETWRALFIRNLDYQQLFPLLPEIVENGPTLRARLRANLDLKEFLQREVEGPFLNDLRTGVKARKYNQAEAVSLLGEWLYYRLRSDELQLTKSKFAGTIDMEIIERNLLADGIINKGRWELE